METEPEERDEGLGGLFRTDKKLTQLTGQQPQEKTQMKMITCLGCGEEFEPYWFKHHHCEGTD